MTYRATFQKQNNGASGVHYIARLLKDVDALSLAGDPFAFAKPPRNLWQFRLGWLPPSNWYRQEYEQKAQITVISISKDGSPVQGGLDPFDKQTSSVPFLTAMSPSGEVFAVANSDGTLDIRQAVTGEKSGKTLHCQHPRDGHNALWMHFLEESSLVTEYECGSIHVHRLAWHPSFGDPETVHSLPPLQPPPNVFSACSLDRSTILRLSKLSHCNKRGADAAKEKEHLDGLVWHPGELLSAHILEYGGRENLPLLLPPLDVSEGWLFDPGSLAISHNNQYAAVVFVEKNGNHHDALRRVHFWSIKEIRYLGFRDVRGPKWELWVPANHFDNFDGYHRFLIRRDVEAIRPLDRDFIVDVYHPNDVRLGNDNRPQQQLPSEDCVFLVVHGGQTRRPHYSKNAISFTPNLIDAGSKSGEFQYNVGIIDCGALLLCIRDIIRCVQATCHEVPLESIGALDKSSVAAACAADAALDVAFDTDPAIRRAALDAAISAARRAATSAGDVATAVPAFAAAIKAYEFSSSLQLECCGVFESKEVFQIPHYLTLPLLLSAHARSNSHYRFSRGRVVLGGYAHPFDRRKWVPVCMLDFTRLLTLKQPDGAG